MRQDGLRKDLTLLYPGNQTAGHYHFGDESEIYEVLSGQALFLMQDRETETLYAIEAKEKDKIVFPPKCGMRTINQSTEKELLVSNWVSDKVENDYSAFKNTQEPIKLKLKKLPPELENLDFLANPEKYATILTIENLYEQP
jgi:oxalate decarboxylase/phosphoglucose isomerase-like protein (cupin superfamily)